MRVAPGILNSVDACTGPWNRSFAYCCDSQPGRGAAIASTTLSTASETKPRATTDADGTVPAMRVVRIITRLNVGGPSIQAITLSDRLTSRGIDTLLVHGRLGEAEGDMRYLLSAGVETRYVPALGR